MPTFHSVPIVEIVSPTLSCNWRNIDVSAWVPVGATGIIVHLDRGATGAVRDYGIRRNGCTDARALSAGGGNSHSWAIIGIDENRIFEFYNIAISNRCAVNLLGYTTEGVNFTPSYTTAPNVSTLAALPNGAWTAIDLGPGGLGLIPADAIGVIFEMQDTSPADDYGLRNNGSTDARVLRTGGEHSMFSQVIGCVDQIVELYRGTAGVQFYLTGYITEGATFYVNALDVTPPVAGAWANMLVMPSDSFMAFLEIDSPGGQRFGATRPTGGLFDYLNTAAGNGAFAFSEDREIRLRAENAGATIFMVGYAHGIPPTAQTNPATGIT